MSLYTANTERARIDSSGRLLVGTSSARANFFNSTLSSAIQVEGNDTNRRISVVGGAEGYPYVILGRQKGSTGQNVSVSSADGLGAITFQGNDGSEFVEAATIEAYVDGTPGANDMPGRLVFSTTADGASSPTERMRITNDGKIGIANNGVIQQGSGIGGGSAAGILELYNGGTGNTTLENTGAFPILFKTNGNERLRITAGGLVGIGTTSPAKLLHVQSGSVSGAARGGSSTKTLFESSDAATSYWEFQAASTASNDILFSKGSTGSYGIVGYDHASDALRFFANSGERARIDSSGRLLVGTSSAAGGQVEAKTAVVSAGNPAYDKKAFIANIAYSTINITSSLLAGFDGAAIHGVDIGYRYNGTGYDLTLGTNSTTLGSPTERMRIGQNGYIQCSETGTYSPDGGSVWHKFYQSVNERCLQTYNTAGTFTNYALTQYIAAGGGTGSGFASGFSDSGSIQRYIIFSNGNIQNTNNSYGAISDLKLKENIVDASEQWNDIKNLRVRKYNLKQGGAHTQIGVIAQEIELVSPGLVYETTDRDTDGNDLGTVTKSVNYSVLYMKAVKALQEAMERIETLEAENAHQKASLTDILSRISALEGA
jgi:hypothetical protein